MVVFGYYHAVVGDSGVGDGGFWLLSCCCWW